MREYIVEFLGTVFCLFVFIVTGNPIAYGAAQAMAMYLGTPISGGQFNPATSILMVLSGKMALTALPPYIIAQCLAALTVYFIYKNLKK